MSHMPPCPRDIRVSIVVCSTNGTSLSWTRREARTATCHDLGSTCWVRQKHALLSDKKCRKALQSLWAERRQLLYLSVPYLLCTTYTAYTLDFLYEQRRLATPEGIL